jgi:hypothetical protein
MLEFLFGKKKAKRRSNKKSTKPPKALINKCKNNGVRVTITSNGKRRYKSVKVLEKQCVVKKIRKRTKRVISQVTGEVKKPMTINRKNVLKKKMRAASIALGGLQSSRRALAQRYPGDKGMGLKSNKDKPKSRRNIIKKKIMAAARMSRLLKESKKQLNKRYPGDSGSLLNPNAESYIPLDQRTEPTEGVKQKQDFGRRTNFGFSYYY